MPFLIFADDVTPPVSALGLWIICLFFFGGACIKIYETFVKDRLNKPMADQPATQSDLATHKSNVQAELAANRAELAAHKTDIKTEWRSELIDLRTSLASYVTRVELQRLEQQLLTVISDHKELARTTQSQYQELQRTSGDMRVSQEALRREIREETSKVAAIVSDKIDELAVMFAAGGALPKNSPRST